MNYIRLLRGFSANALSQFVNIGLQLLLVPIMASQWGLERYGLWLMLAAVPSYLALSDFGFGTAASNRMIIEIARGERGAAIVTYQSAWCLVAGVTGFLSVTFVVGYLMLPAGVFGEQAFASDEIRASLLLLFLYGIFAFQGAFVQAPLKAEGRYATGVVLQSASSLLEGLILAGLAFTTTNLSVVAASLLCARLVSLVFQFLFVRKAVPSIRLGVKMAERTRMKELWRPATAAMVIPLSQALFLQGTTVMLGLAASPAAVPAFVAVRTLVRSGVQLTTLLNHAIMPEMSAAVGRRDENAQVLLVGATLLTSIGILMPMAVFLLFAGSKCVHFWTHGALSADPSLISIMTGVMLLNGIWHPLSNLLLAANLHQSFSYFFVALAGLAALLTYPATLMLGPMGAAVSLFLLDLIMLRRVAREINRSFLSNATISEAVTTTAKALIKRLSPGLKVS